MNAPRKRKRLRLRGAKPRPPTVGPSNASSSQEGDVTFLHEQPFSAGRTIGLYGGLCLFMVVLGLLITYLTGGFGAKGWSGEGVLLIILMIFRLLCLLIVTGLMVLFVKQMIVLLGAKNGWEYRIENSLLTVTPPSPKVSKGVRVEVESIREVVEEYPCLKSGPSSIREWKLYLQDGTVQDLPEDAGIWMDDLVAAIIHENARVKVFTERDYGFRKEKTPRRLRLSSSGG